MTREEVVRIIKECKEKGFKHTFYTLNEYHTALDIAIKALEQEPKTGQWIKYGTPRCGEQHYQCTSCGYYINFGQWGELYTKEFKYCPNCGAKMIEPQESGGKE